MDNPEEVSHKGENMNKIQPSVDFGSNTPPERTMGNIEESPGHIEKKHIKESRGKVSSRGRLQISAPLSKTKIEESKLKIEESV